MQLRPPLLQHYIETVISFIYPAQCRVCDNVLGFESIPYVCDTCCNNIDIIVPPWCNICGIPNTEDVCDNCATKPPQYGKLRTIALYRGTLQQLIHLYKFEKRTTLVKYLAHLITTNLPNDISFTDYDFIVPIPIHKKRLKERGFNQTTLLANHISKITDNQVETNSLIRKKNTSPQSSLDREARNTNIIGAFQLLNSDIFYNKQILLLDDVYTTGATVQEAVKVLWNADPKEIDILTLARALDIE